jgi:hypothetical protein
MAATRGFEVVAQVTVGVLRQILREAWKNGGDGSGEGVIPQRRTLAPGLAFGPYRLADGEITVPESGLGLDMNPSVNGVTVGLGILADIEIADPPIPSARLFNLTADIAIAAPVGVVEPATHKIGVVLGGLPASAVTVTLTSGDPVGPITVNAIAEFVHAQYQDPASTFPRTIEGQAISFPPFSMRADLTIFDDEADPSRRITVDPPSGGTVTLNLPCRLRFYDIEGSYAGVSLASPMATDGVIRFTCPYDDTQPSKIVATPAAGNAVLANLVAAPGPEGANYSSNSQLAEYVLGPNGLPNLIASAFAPRATAELRRIAPIEVFVPTVADIETFIADQIRAEMNARGHIAIWRPEAPEGSDVAIDNVATKALADVMAICINAGPATDIDALTRLVPAGKDFCVAVSAGKVRAAIDDAIRDEFPDGFPHRYQNIEGYDADLESLSLTLDDGDFIKLEGDVTVIDAIVDKIDVGASFEAKVDLQWEDADGGGQTIKPFLQEEPDIDMSAWAWIVSFIIGFIVGGVIGVIVVAVVLVVVENIATRIGGAVIRDEVSNQFKGISAWPQTLDSIGTISARFDPPVDIDRGGILSSGSMLITATYALTTRDRADAHGPYLGQGGQPLLLDGGGDVAVSTPEWQLGDGAASAMRRPTHVFGDSGVYVSKLRIRVNEDGGATTRNLVRTTIANVAPIVTLGPDVRIKEGEEFELVARFEDAEWLDTHSAVFDWGDNHKPSVGEVTETNAPPRAVGTARARHAYCTNGTYRITVRVTDSDGGVGEASIDAIVENVPPKVLLPEKLCVLVDQPVRLTGRFEDAGWCDTHIAVWHFGDCASQAAIIAETHRPPQGEGMAEAVHRFARCGVHLARLVVTDSDGAAGEATMAVHAVELRNRRFEDGFHRRGDLRAEAVEVANHWRPLSAPWPTIDKEALAAGTGARFGADARDVASGQRAQRIEIAGPTIAGIAQTVCVNPGWAYELEGRFNLPLGSAASAMVGIDPSGGDDILSPAIVWAEAPPADDWGSAAVRATAAADHVTLFLAVASRGAGRATIGWDSAELMMIQPWCPAETCVARRVSVAGLEGRELATMTFVDGIWLGPLDAPARLVDAAQGRAVCALKTGLRLRFGAVDTVTLELLLPVSSNVQVDLFVGDTLIRQVMEALPSGERTLVLREPGLTGLDMRGSGRGFCLLGVTGCFPRLAQEPPARTECLTFEPFLPRFESMKPFDLKGFTLTPHGRTPARLVTWGDPNGTAKLTFADEGLAIDLPFPAARATIRIAAHAGKGMLVAAYAGATRVALLEEPVSGQPRTLVIERPGMDRITISGGGNEAVLTELCIADRIEPAAEGGAPTMMKALSRRKGSTHG